MRFITTTLRRRAVTWATAGVAVTAVAGALSLTAGVRGPGDQRPPQRAFSFALVPSPGIKSCCRTLAAGSPSSRVAERHHGGLDLRMPANADFDLFVIQQPNKPFGVSWYQTDVTPTGTASATPTVRGVFRRRDVLRAPGGTTTFGPTISTTWACGSTTPTSRSTWAASPTSRVTSRSVTPFNGEQNAGIQVLKHRRVPGRRGAAVARAPLTRPQRVPPWGRDRPALCQGVDVSHDLNRRRAAYWDKQAAGMTAR